MDADHEKQRFVNGCPECRTLIDVTDHEPFARVVCPGCDNAVRVRTMFHHFLITEQIGVGGMSRVFRARDTSLERDVALKILNKECSRDRKRARQFEKEAEITAKIPHPNVVRVYTAGRDQGHFYIAMELVSGGSLEGHIRDHRIMKEERVLELAIQTVQGLKAAHDAGLIHRDIKPGNILFSDDGTPKIVDFGLAIFARDSDGSGEIWATPYYVPPETLHHEPEDFRSDIYSLAATLYHVLIGKPPCDKDTASLDELKELKSHPIHLKPSVHRLSEETCAVIERAMATKPADRYASYDEFLDHLKFAQRRLRRGNKGKRWPGRRKRGLNKWQWTGAAAALLAAAGGLWMALRREKLQGTGDATGGGSLVTDADPAAGSDSSTSTRFLRARDAMLDGNFGKARQYFEELGDNTDTRQPTRNWARFNAGLCALFMGDSAGARAIYRTMAGESLYSTSHDDADLAHFFANTSRWLAADGPVAPSQSVDCPADSVRAVGLLAAGLKNWNTGEPAAAGDYLRAFDSATPPRSGAWVEGCKRLARPFLDDTALLASLEFPDVSKLSAPAAEDALKTARELVAKLAQPGLCKEKAAAAVGELAARVAARRNELLAMERAAHDKIVNGELKMIHEANAAAATLGESFRFADAAAKLKSLNVTAPESAAVRDAHVQAWKNAASFIDQIGRDLARQPVEGVVEHAGAPLRASFSATGAVLTARPAQGPEIKIPLSKTRPDELARLAADILTRISDSDEYYRRWELLFCFALRTGLKNTVADCGAALASEWRKFREELALLNTTEIVSAPTSGAQW